MDPKKVKLTFSQTIIPTLKLYRTALVACITFIVLLTVFTIYVTSILPIIVSNKAVNVILNFGLASLLIFCAILPVVGLIAFAMDSKDGLGKLWNEFKEERRQLLLEAKKKAIEDVDRQILG